MRRLFVALISGLLATLPAGAQQAPQPASGAAAEQSRLDQLFGQLRRERNEKAAERLSSAIRAEWLNSGSATVDLLMQWAGKAIQEKKNEAALDFLDQVIVLKPDFAEGWNRRATLHFAMDNYAKSMSDIERTLELEPRHFGALAGLATIMTATDRKQLALDAYMRVLEIYPMLRSAQTEAGKLADELAGRGI